MDDEKSELLYALFTKLLQELNEIKEKESIKNDDIDSIIKSYEKKLKIIMNRSAKKPSFSLKYGQSYIIDEEKPVECYNIFKQAISRGSSGLCITRTHPESISFYGSAKNVKFIWLSKANVEGKKEYTSLQPSDLNIIVNNITDFIKSNLRGVILLEGLEMLYTNSGFQNLIKAITTIKDLVAENKGVFLISVNLKSFKEEEKNILIREFNPITVP
ncbi:MAG: DUF835 domain-containing protein [Thermoplasmata archaeon]|nr:DUF835 domain-containing protein [Thermoplasmata archaeon]